MCVCTLYTYTRIYNLACAMYIFSSGAREVCVHPPRTKFLNALWLSQELIFRGFKCLQEKNCSMGSKFAYFHDCGRQNSSFCRSHIDQYLPERDM